LTNKEQDFLEIINDNQLTIMRICRTYGKGLMEAQDLFQEVMANLWKGFSSFRGDSSRATWIYRVTLYTCMQYYRKQKRQTELNKEIPNPQTIIEDDDQKDDQIHALRSAIRHLAEIDRAIMILYLEEHSYAEIGNILGLSESNIGVRITRAKQKIKKFMDSEHLSYG
jgi:RNA polymerase sigma-70 factor (ECF subfamily)